MLSPKTESNPLLFSFIEYLTTACITSRWECFKTKNERNEVCLVFKQPTNGKKKISDIITQINGMLQFYFLEEVLTITAAQYKNKVDTFGFSITFTNKTDRDYFYNEIIKKYNNNKKPTTETNSKKAKTNTGNTGFLTIPVSGKIEETPTTDKKPSTSTNQKSTETKQTNIGKTGFLKIPVSGKIEVTWGTYPFQKSYQHQSFQEIKYTIVGNPVDYNGSISKTFDFSLTEDELFILENSELWLDSFIYNTQRNSPETYDWHDFIKWIKQNFDIVLPKKDEDKKEEGYLNTIFDKVEEIVICHSKNSSETKKSSENSTDVNTQNKTLYTTLKSPESENEKLQAFVKEYQDRMTLLINAVKKIAETYNDLKNKINDKSKPLLTDLQNKWDKCNKNHHVINTREELPLLSISEGISCDNKEIDFTFAFVVLSNKNEAEHVVRNWIQTQFGKPYIANNGEYKAPVAHLTVKKIELRIDKHLVGWAIQFPKKLFDRFLKPSESDFLSPIKIYSKTHETGDGSMFNKRKTRTMRFLVPTGLDAGNDKGFQSFLEQLYEGEEKQKTLYTQIEQAMECEFKNEVEKDFIPYLQNVKNSGETAVIIPTEMLKQIYIITKTFELVDAWLQKTETDDNTSVLPSEFYSYKRSDKKLVLATRVIDTKKAGLTAINTRLGALQESIFGKSPIPESVSFEIRERGNKNRFYRIHIIINEDRLKTILNAHPSIKDYSTVKAEDDKMLVEYANSLTP